MLKKVLRYTLLLLLLLAGNLAISQTVKKIPADKQRALRWKPE
jgi:predicted proteasome-type protease